MTNNNKDKIGGVNFVIGAGPTSHEIQLQKKKREGINREQSKG